MRFTYVDDFLTRQMTDALRSSSAERPDMRLVRFARGVAVYELSPGKMCDRIGAAEKGVLTSLADAAMTTAAATTVTDVDDAAAIVTRELSARFEQSLTAIDGELLRAEAIVVRAGEGSIRTEAEVLCRGLQLATFKATCVCDRDGAPRTARRGLSADVEAVTAQVR